MGCMGGANRAAPHGLHGLCQPGRPTWAAWAVPIGPPHMGCMGCANWAAPHGLHGLCQSGPPAWAAWAAPTGPPRMGCMAGLCRQRGTRHERMQERCMSVPHELRWSDLAAYASWAAWAARAA
eukprot:364862-Chlamydomonas_euryale.AAC.13